MKKNLAELFRNHNKAETQQQFVSRLSRQIIAVLPEALSLAEVSEQLRLHFISHPEMEKNWRWIDSANLVEVAVGLFWPGKQLSLLPSFISDMSDRIAELQQFKQNVPLLNWIQKDVSTLLQNPFEKITGLPQFASFSPTFARDDFLLLLNHPNVSELMAACTFRELCLINSVCWKRDSRFSLGFLLNFPELASFLSKYVQAEKSEDLRVSDWSEALTIFDYIMGLIGRAGVTTDQITTKLKQKYLEGGGRFDSYTPQIFLDDPMKELEIRLHTGQNLLEDWNTRQEILTENGSYAPEWRTSPEQLARLKFLESENNPLRFLHVSHGWEIEYFETLRNKETILIVKGKFQNEELYKMQQVLDPAVYALLHHMQIMHLGNQMGEISPGPWYLPEHSSLFFTRFLDAGLLDTYANTIHSCHWNLGMRTQEMFAAVCHMMRTTGYSYGAQPDLLKPSNKNFTIRAETKPVDSMDKYCESKQFRFFSVPNHQLFMEHGVKLAQAAKAAEQIIGGPNFTVSGPLEHISVNRIANLRDNDVNVSFFATLNQRRLAKIWVKVFALYRDGLAQINAPDLWLKTVPASQEIELEHCLDMVFPTGLSHLDLSRADDVYTISGGSQKDSQIVVNGKTYANFIQFNRKIIAQAAEEVDQVMDSAYSELGQVVARICQNYQEQKSSDASGNNGKLLRWCLNNYDIPTLGNQKGNSFKLGYSQLARMYKDYFFELQHQLQMCGILSI